MVKAVALIEAGVNLDEAEAVVVLDLAALRDEIQLLLHNPNPF
jgi:hypothetical protein